MKTKVVKLEDVENIIYDYWNQIGETISSKAKEYLEEQMNNCSFEIELEE